jgi:hypothetical protein
MAIAFPVIWRRAFCLKARMDAAQDDDAPQFQVKLIGFSLYFSLLTGNNPKKPRATTPHSGGAIAANRGLQTSQNGAQLHCCPRSTLPWKRLALNSLGAPTDRPGICRSAPPSASVERKRRR